LFSFISEIDAFYDFFVRINLIAQEKIMFINSLLLAAAQSTVPATPEWNPTVGLVMILCNLFAFAIGRFAIQKKGVGPDLPGSKPAILANFGVPELLATASFGHILGAGVILGLANAGAL
jgi:photosystem I subunit X